MKQTNPASPDILIVGAGPAGLTAAAECVRLRGGSGVGITLLEQEPSTVGAIFIRLLLTQVICSSYWE